jgi:hypothetical protein
MPTAAGAPVIQRTRDFSREIASEFEGIPPKRIGDDVFLDAAGV